MVTGFLAICMSVGNLIFNLTSYGGTFNSLVPFPVLYICIAISNITLLSGSDARSRSLMISKYSCVTTCFTLTLLAFIGNIIAMVIFITNFAFGRPFNAGIIPMTIFNGISIMVHMIMTFAYAVGVRRLDLINRGLVPPLVGGVPPAA